MPPIDTFASVTALAAQSSGLVTTRDLRAAGVSEQSMTALMKHGVLVSVRRGVHRLRGATERVEDELLSAILLCARPGVAFASHISAVWLFGLSWPTPLQIERPPRPQHVTVILERLPHGRGLVVHRSGRLESNVTMMRGVPCTTPERTILDVSARLSVADLGILIDSALRNRLTTITRIGLCSERHHRAPGRSPKRVAAALAARLPNAELAESPLEEFVYDSIARFGLPLPTPQHWIEVDGRRYRIDHCYPAEKYALETQSRLWHGQRSDDDRDALKGNDVAIADYKLLQFSSSMTDWDIATTVARALVQPLPPRPAHEVTYAEWRHLHRV
jgi:hypothetical protein